MKAQDRNTAITILVVLVVCTISLIAIGSFLWNLIAPGVAEFGQVLGAKVSTINNDSNFAVPSTEEAVEVIVLIEEKEKENEPLNYNFQLPTKN